MQVPHLRSLLPAGAIALASLVSAAHASAQSKAQQAATAAFRDCLEMEEFGDATPCWRRYLDKHRAAGNEGEIVLAEERTSGRKPPKKNAAPEEPAEAPQKPESEADPEATEAEETEAEPEEEEEEEEEEEAPEEPEAASAEASTDDLGGLGLTVQAHGTLGSYFLDQFHYAPYGAISTPNSSLWVRQTFALPEVMYGGGIALAYDVKRFGEMDLAVRAGGDFVMGNGTALQAQLISMEVLGVLGFPMGPVRGYVGLGPTLSLAKVRAVPY
jgi:hypothetical protein